MNAIDELLQDLKEAKDLLERIYLQLGPYNNVLNPELKSDLNKYMKFDDSE